MDLKDRIYHLFKCRCCRKRHDNHWNSCGSLYFRGISYFDCCMRCRLDVLWCRRRYTRNCSCKNSNKKKAYPLNVQALAANIKVLSKLLKFGTAFNGAVFPTVSTAAKWLPKFVQMPWAP